jgi:PAS domain S-box-containing protein
VSPLRGVWASFVEGMPLGAAVWRLEDPEDDASIVLVAANAAAGAASGLDLAGAVGSRLVALFPASTEHHALAEMIRTGAAPTVDSEDRAYGGALFAMRRVPLPDRCVGLLVEDVTERRRADAEVRESEARYRALAEATTEAVGIHEDGRIVEVNGAFTRMFGYARAEAVGLGVDQLVAPASLEAMRADTALRRDDRREYLAQRKDGSVLPIEVAVRSCTFQGRAARVVVARDLTEQRRGEEALRAGESRFRVVARATHDAIWEQDLATGHTSRGETFAALFGYRVEDVGPTADWWVERVHPDDRARILTRLAAWRASGAESCAEEYRFLRGDGRWAHVFDRGVLVRGPGGEPRQIIGAMMDITERKELEGKLLFADRMASVGTLAAGVAHEINNPLSYLIANLRLVGSRLRALALEPARDPDALREALAANAAALDEAGEGAERVHRIVADLKTFARAEEDRRTQVDVRRVLEAALQLADHELRRRARLVCEIAEVPAVLANEARLGQVFLNLVVHAAEAIAPGAPDANEIRVAACVDARGVVVEIRDTGPGLPEEVRAGLFQPFFSAKLALEDGAPQSSQRTGSGLGLSVSHAIVTALGGEITVESAPGKGSCFRVVLPVAPAPPPPETAQGPAPGLAVAPRVGRVLVVDDEPMVGRMVERALGDVHRVTAVLSGKDALERLVAGERYDVILCDLMMPAMTGMDLYDRVVALDPGQAAKMVFLSGGAFTSRAREFLEQRPSLDKPFDLEALEAAIQARL